MSKIEAKLKELNLELPKAPQPIGVYVPVKQIGNLVYTSGILPLQNDGSIVQGHLGEDLTIEEGKKAAALAILNALAALKSHLGNLDRVREIIRMTGFISCSPDFFEHPQVMNGASELLGQIFGEAGKHTRLALGAVCLPKNASVEIDLVVAIE